MCPENLKLIASVIATVISVVAAVFVVATVIVTKDAHFLTVLVSFITSRDTGYDNEDFINCT